MNLFLIALGLCLFASGIILGISSTFDYHNDKIEKDEEENGNDE